MKAGTVLVQEGYSGIASPNGEIKVEGERKSQVKFKQLW